MINFCARNLAFFGHIILFGLLGLWFFLIKDFPLLATLGFESANIVVTIFGPLLALIICLRQHHQHFSQLFMRELWWLLTSLLFLGALLFTHGFYVKSCSEGQGLLAFLIIALPPLLLTMTIATMMVVLIKKIIIRLLAMLAFYISYAALVAFCFWQTPSFRIMTHLSWIMDSDLMRGASLSSGIVLFRSATLLLALMLIMLGYALEQKRKHWFFIALIFLSGLSSFVLHYQGMQALGKNRRDLAIDYKVLAQGEEFLIYGDPLKTSKVQAQAILAEAHYYRWKIAPKLGELSKEPITIFLHPSSEEKASYTGAKNVHFALPRHREIHISGYDIPHPVLGHELAHIYVGEFSFSLFGVPGDFLWPNLALTEGIATMLTTELNITQGLSLIEQAQSLYQIGMAIDKKAFFQSNTYFLSLQSRVSYIYSGAVLELLMDDIPQTARMERLQDLIYSGTLSALFPGENIDDYLNRLDKKLSQVVPSGALAWAKESFEKGSVLTKNCLTTWEHEVAYEQAVLNGEFMAATQALNNLSAKDKRSFLEMGIEQALLKNDHASALHFFAAIALLPPVFSPLSSELKIKEIGALIGAKQFEQALQALYTLDQTQLLTAHKRLYLVVEGLLDSYGNHESSLSKAALAFLFAQPNSESQFLYELGKHDSFDTAYSGNLLSQYIYARFLQHNLRYQESLPYIEHLLNNQHYLPALLVRETKNMAAQAHGQQEAKAAVIAYEALLPTSTSKGEQVYLLDAIDRLNFKYAR